jgi:hypothetical protein
MLVIVGIFIGALVDDVPEQLLLVFVVVEVPMAEMMLVGEVPPPIIEA